MTWADQGERTLSEALAEVDLVVTSPHAATMVPAELEPWLSPTVDSGFIEQWADHLIAAVCRRWAQIDPAVIYLENPHPWFVFEPNITPGVYRPLVDDFESAARAETISTVKSRGADVYARARQSILENLQRMTAGSPPGTIATVSVHDSIDFRGQSGLLGLSNRGDSAGNSRPEDPNVTMEPERLRLLADSHRTGLRVSSHDQVALNRPRIGGYEIVDAARRFPQIDAVSAEFRREFLTGGADELSPERIENLAQDLQRSWLHYRTSSTSTSRI